ncbi:MAG: NAD(P)-binding domain-containing protein [Geminicoccaceae bacterium]
MKAYPTVIIGAGQCGLAMSRVLSERSVDHVILERGEVANSWRTERWDSLRLLTPNWQSRLPGSAYDGPDPDGYMTMPELIQRFETYAIERAAPIITGAEVRSVVQTEAGYRIETSRGSFKGTTLVLANGACAIPSIPAFAEELPRGVHAITPRDYKRPSDLPEGGVLVVGGSATGVQLAMELQASGRQVTLSLGEHIRMPRTYRGRDIKWWMDEMGIFDQRHDEVDDVKRVRRTPSLQLIGSPERRTLDLNGLMEAGVEVVGRFSGLRDGRAMFSGSLANQCTLADLKMNRFLDQIDLWAAEAGLDGLSPAHRFEPTRVPASPRLEMDLTGGSLTSVLWATGYRPDYAWLQVPVLDRKGHLRHDGGIVDAPGLFAMGLPFMKRRKSTLIDGAGADARDLANHVIAHLDRATGKTSLTRHAA